MTEKEKAERGEFKLLSGILGVLMCLTILGIMSVANLLSYLCCFR